MKNDINSSTIIEHPSKSGNFNISLLVTEFAESLGSKPAIVTSYWDEDLEKNIYQETTYQEFDKKISTYSYKFQSQGIKNNDRVLLMVPPGIEMISSIFALLRLGAIVVLVDGGIEIEKMLSCIEISRPSALLGVHGIIELSQQYRDIFSTVNTIIGFGDNLPENIIGIDAIETGENKHFQPIHKNENDLSFILFTSGSTGSPKGVEYTPKMLFNQLDTMRKTWNFNSTDVNMPIFPAFTIGSIGLGMTVVIPDMDAANPSKADPQKIYHALNDYKVTYSFAAPAFWLTMLNYCKVQEKKLPHLKIMMVGGAPVPDELLVDFKEYLPNGTVQVTLGATEASAVTTISNHELVDDALLLTQQGKGVCVGGAVAGNEIKILSLNFKNTDSNSFSDNLIEEGEIGELVVAGEGVSQRYFRNEDATKRAKVFTNEGKMYHRMGDSGYIDSLGRFWFCGRVSHICKYQNRYWYPSKIEAALDSIIGIRRTALVNIFIKNKPYLVLCVEINKTPYPDYFDREAFSEKLSQLNYPIKFILKSKSGFPVDIRHNSKIDRKSLGRWAQTIFDNNEIETFAINLTEHSGIE